ncbi:hypothetical protein M0802_014697 [Mischocyttarus mexicanus]|nr:hypothetical protein M0802_014697 [Mischocyttarus mexicanus]
MLESSLDENDLIEFMTIYDNKEVDNYEVEGKGQLLTDDFIREGLKFATSMEQYFLTHDSDIMHSNVNIILSLNNLKFNLKFNLKKPK